MQDWLRGVQMETEPPTAQQMEVLQRVRQRVIREFEERTMGDDLSDAMRRLIHEPEEPLRALVHGQPGTGKSKVITWIRSFFEEELEWTNGEQFICAALNLIQLRRCEALSSTDRRRYEFKIPHEICQDLVRSRLMKL